jgi:CheY-like chemotaxis protein
MSGDSSNSEKKLDRTKILVVDDEKGIRDIFLHVVTHHLPNVRADVVANGAEALDAFYETRYAVLLLDIRMPVMDGQSTFENIMKHCEDNGIEKPAIVFCTGYEPPAALMEAISADPKHCVLRKPVKNNDLIETLQSRL